jgi:indole-3-acetate monooxygenase
MNSLLERTRALTGEIRERAVDHEKARQVSAQTVLDLQSLDILRAYVPKKYGGPEYDPMETLAAVELLSAADGATGWVSTIASLTSHIAGSLNEDVGKVVFGAATSSSCGAYAPTGQAAVKDGALLVNGRWAWGSGSSFATWMSGGTICDDNTFRHVFFPTKELTMHDTWHSSGLRATASNDFSAENLVVPQEFSAILGSRPTVDARISWMPIFVLFSGGVASVMLGIAQRAMEEIATLAASKKPMMSAKTVADSAVNQQALARAEASIHAARAFLLDTVNSAWETVQRGDQVDMETRLRARMAATYAAEQACDTVDVCYRMGGGTAVYETSPLQRCFRDIHTAAAHIMVGSRSYEMAGRHRFGLQIDTGSL